MAPNSEELGAIFLERECIFTELGADSVNHLPALQLGPERRSMKQPGLIKYP